MAFPVFTPSYFKELVDVTGPEEKYKDFSDIIVSPAAVEYVLYLSNPDVVRRMMKESTLSFKMVQLTGEKELPFIESSKAAVEANPTAEYYWQLRSLFMGTLQNKAVSLESRLLLLNYGVKTVQGMIDQGQPNLIPRFIERFVMDTDYEKTLKFFDGISFTPAFSLVDGISLLKAVKKSTPAFKEVMAEVYKNLGVSGPETLNLVDMNKYVKLREKYRDDFLANHSDWMENILVNYVWTYCIPYACSDKLDIWDNYVFFCALYNAYKVLLTCYMDGKGEEDFVKAVSSFDDALRQSGDDLIWKMVLAIKNAGEANNGDMAILVLS